MHTNLKRLPADSTRIDAGGRPARKRTSRCRMLLGAVVMTALAFTATGLAVGTSPAGAAVYGGSMYCQRPWGAQSPGNLHIGVSSAPAGTTVAVYLYKSSWNGRAWSAWQYQGYQAAVASNNYGWSIAAINGAFDFTISTTPAYYYINMRTWNPAGQLIESVNSNSALYC